MNEAIDEARPLLGDDLYTLIQQAGINVMKIGPLARLQAPAHSTAAFRIHQLNGCDYKARRTWSEERARQIAYFLEHLQELDFPRVFARYKRALLLEWVEGQPLSAPSSEETLQAAGELLGRLHQQPAPPDCPYAVDKSVQRLQIQLLQQLDHLLAAGVVSSEEADTCLRITEVPTGKLPTGIVHTDLSPGNLVVASAGRLRSIDNESLQINYLALDLSRTWYRWPLDHKAGATFLQAYSRFSDASTFLKAFPFWLIGTLVDAMVYRLGSTRQVLAVPANRLRSFLYDPSAHIPQLP